MNANTRVILTIVSCTALAFAGCDPQSGTDAGTGVDGGSDAGSDSGAKVILGSLTVNVIGFQVWNELEAPLPGATVALEMADGSLSEAVTDSSGRVVFNDVNWGPGPVSVTGHLDGYRLRSLVGLNEPSAEVDLFLQNLSDPTDIVDVSGTATMLDDTSHVLLVTAEVTGSTWTQSAGASWSLTVPVDTPFTLVGLEFHGGSPQPAGGIYQIIDAWTIVSHPGIDAPTMVDLDLSSAPVTPNVVSGSFDLPTRPESPLRAAAMGYVQVGAGAAATGFSTYLEISPDGNSFDYDLEWVDLNVTRDLQIQYFLIDVWPEFRAVSVVNGEPPTHGPQDVVFLDVPRLLAPADPAVATPLHETIEWELFDAGVVVALQVLGNSEPIWEIFTTVDATSLTVPTPPSSVDLAALLGAAALSGRLVVADPELKHIDWQKGPTYIRPDLVVRMTRGNRILLQL